MRLNAWFYQEFDADYDLDLPAEGYGGWLRHPVDLSLERTALVVMHAWDCGTREQYPGWYRTVEYIPRSTAICRDIFPPLLNAAREAGMPVVHVVGGGTYYQTCPGYLRAVKLAGPPPPPVEGAPSDAAIQELRQLKQRLSHPGDHNQADIAAGFANLDFGVNARPRDDELVAPDAHHLNACCRHLGVTHLIYIGFAINWCLVMSPGGMVDMQRLGYLCSTIREATTAVENRESARTEAHKEEALWRVAIHSGLVFDLPDFLTALH